MQVRRQDVSRRYHKQEIGVFVGTCPISASGAPCLCFSNVLKLTVCESLETGIDTHTHTHREVTTTHNA